MLHVHCLDTRPALLRYTVTLIAHEDVLDSHLVHFKTCLALTSKAIEIIQNYILLYM